MFRKQNKSGSAQNYTVLLRQNKYKINRKLVGKTKRIVCFRFRSPRVQFLISCYTFTMDFNMICFRKEMILYSNLNTEVSRLQSSRLITKLQEQGKQIRDSQKYTRVQLAWSLVKRPQSFSRYWTWTSYQQRLTRATVIKKSGN